jgi:hypothetical protein
MLNSAQFSSIHYVEIKWTYSLDPRYAIAVPLYIIFDEEWWVSIKLRVYYFYLALI